MWLFIYTGTITKSVIHSLKGVFMNQNFMKEKKILPLIISMSLPMVISMAVNSLYNIVDSYFVAKISDNAMTALSVVFPCKCCNSLLSWGKKAARG